MRYSPKPIEWGQNNKERAKKAYETYMTKNGHENLELKNCGFIIHPTQGWLGASPDGLVHDPASHNPSDILEIKCPYTKRDVTPKEACQDRDFYCTLED